MSATLLVLAAGMGSRYGGLKQLDPVGPSGEVILDYSVHDALIAGFDRVVFVIRKDFEEAFRDGVLKRYDGVVNVELCYQDANDLPGGRLAPADRAKPWGTGHAIWSARNVVREPFLAVNADDFYGRDAYTQMSGFLAQRVSGTLHMGMVAYGLENTLSENGSVARGVCTVSDDGELLAVEEHTGILQAADGTISGMSPSGITRELHGGQSVSMNFWGFTPEIFGHLEALFGEFLDAGGLTKPGAEFYIPSAVSALIASGVAPASVLQTTARWFGVTYREDRELVARSLAEMSRDGRYQSPLWKVIS